MFKYYCQFILVVMFTLPASLLWAQAAQPLRDPTTPLGYKVVAGKQSATVTEYELNSILISTRRKLAVINGQTLREGQLIAGSAGVRIQSISAKRVVLQQANKSWELSLTPTTIRKH